MNYEQKYKEALEKLRAFHRDYKNISHLVDVKGELESIFPELKESEDERIRKEIIQSIQDNMCVIHKDKCIAWLEKQANIPHFTFDDILALQCAMKATEKADNELYEQLKSLHDRLNDVYWLEKQGKNKDQNNRIYIQKFNIGDTVYRQGWSDNTIEKIYNDGKFEPVYICKNEEGLESHISFSEQDEWKLKDRMQSQPKQEWSEEDNIKCIYSYLELYLNHATDINEIEECKYLKDWLKSLKPQNHWKPSEEQMQALKKRTHGLHTSSETRKALESLIDDLTKL